MSTDTITPPICPRCQVPMALRTTLKYRYPNGKPRRFWGCTRYPDCDCCHGAHPNGEPVGIPTADPEILRARNAAHAVFDRLWKREEGGHLSRKAAYRVMQRLMRMTPDEAHIGRFDKAQCELLIQRLEHFRNHNAAHAARIAAAKQKGGHRAEAR